ncbi:MAG TPA: ATP-binding protein [Gemmatimonadaceae bacterium]|nr:ATP-binding protein [Gemmatimonadaceae bacterium]
MALPRILIVDDEAPHVQALCDTLGDHGFETVGVTTGAAALSKVREEAFELLLTDLAMPEMTGIALIQSALIIDPEMMAVVMTGQGTIATAVEAMQSGAFDYILKPFKVSVVLPVLLRALAVRQLRIENVDLHRRVRERTAELEAANRELEAFSYSVSHDLRAPLRAMDGFANMVNEDFAHLLPAEGRELLDRIMANAQRMSQLIDDLLRLSQIGRQPLAAQTVNIGDVARETLDELLRGHENRHIDVRVDDVPDCIGDLGTLRQLVANLLSNAIKFTARVPQAIVEVGAQLVSGETVFFFRDNGAGFSMQHAPRLFGVFERLHTSEEFDGTGIGLSIAQRIIQRHGGRIWADAAVGTGATFSFTIPAPTPPSPRA